MQALSTWVKIGMKDFLEKRSSLKDKPVWHFIGSLQTRKVKNIIDKVDYIHSVDRLSLAVEINKRPHHKNKVLYSGECFW